MRDRAAGSTVTRRRSTCGTRPYSSLAFAVAVVLSGPLLPGCGDDSNAENDIDAQESGVSNDISSAFGDADFIVFMHPNASPAQIDAVRLHLEDNEAVVEVAFQDQEAALEEFRRLFSDDAALLESVRAEILPPSFKVEVSEGIEEVEPVGAVYSTQPGVREVVYRSRAGDLDPTSEEAERLCERVLAGSDQFGDFDFIVFLNPNATDAQIGAVGDALEAHNQVTEVEYQDQEAALEEFRDLFSDDPALLENVTAEILPTSYKVALDDSVTDAEVVGEAFSGEPGVREVAFRASRLPLVCGSA